MDLLQLKNGSTARDLARAQVIIKMSINIILNTYIVQVSAGDSVMTRLHNYVKSDGGKIDEQIEKNTGKQHSAEHLTWSYANILHALHIRK